MGIENNALRKKSRGRSIQEILLHRPDLRRRREEAFKQHYTQLRESKDVSIEGIRAQFTTEYGPLPRNADNNVTRRYKILMIAYMRLRTMKDAGYSQESLARMETRCSRFWEAYENALNRFRRDETDIMYKKFADLREYHASHPDEYEQVQLYLEKVMRGELPLLEQLREAFKNIEIGYLSSEQIEAFERQGDK